MVYVFAVKKAEILSSCGQKKGVAAKINAKLDFEKTSTIVEKNKLMVKEHVLEVRVVDSVEPIELKSVRFRFSKGSI